MRGGVVGTVMSNLGLERALQELSVPFVRAKVGDRHIMEALHQRQWTAWRGTIWAYFDLGPVQYW